jgi:hypothetical protein
MGLYVYQATDSVTFIPITYDPIPSLKLYHTVTAVTPLTFVLWLC